MVIDNLKIISFKNNIEKYIDQLVQLDVVSLGSYGETWEKENFLMDLPLKGQLSKFAIIDEKLAGYLICSSYQNKKACHGHRMAVHPDYRKLGIASKLWREVFKECLRLEIERITVETPNNNLSINRLYAKFGVHPLKGSDLKNYVITKGKEDQITRFGDGHDKFGAYFIELRELVKNGLV